MSYDERMNALDNHGRVLGIPVRELSGIGKGLKVIPENIIISFLTLFFSIPLRSCCNFKKMTIKKWDSASHISTVQTGYRENGTVFCCITSITGIFCRFVRNPGALKLPVTPAWILSTSLDWVQMLILCCEDLNNQKKNSSSANKHKRTMLVPINQ